MMDADVMPITKEQIAQHYRACLDSVSTINDAIDNPDHYKGDPDVIKRNVIHLEIMRTQDFWEDQDMAPIDDAIELGLSAIAGGL